MMLSGEAIASVVETVRGEDFYRPAHRRIYESILAIYARGEPVDAITTVEELKRHHELEDVGGRDAAEEAAVAARLGAYAQGLRRERLGEGLGLREHLAAALLVT